MSKNINLTVDGAPLRTTQGSSVLEAALSFGICIPHLCHMKNLTDIGVCRLCIVEVVRGNRSSITTSCTLEAEEGMEILAHSDEILRLRKNVAELLVAEAPNSRAIQDIAARCGVKTVRYPFHNADCILCGRCVRVCSELWQAEALGFVGRGKERHVALPFNTRPEYCKKCWSCVDNCPMTIKPCEGSMDDGEEYFCGKCASQLSTTDKMPDSCVWCKLGEGFHCTRWN